MIVYVWYVYFKKRMKNNDMNICFDLWENSHTQRMPRFHLREISQCILHLLCWLVIAFFHSVWRVLPSQWTNPWQDKVLLDENILYCNGSLSYWNSKYGASCIWRIHSPCTVNPILNHILYIQHMNVKLIHWWLSCHLFSKWLRSERVQTQSSTCAYRTSNLLPTSSSAVLLHSVGMMCELVNDCQLQCCLITPNAARCYFIKRKTWEHSKARW